jgi:hypothetical protein
LYEKGRKVFEEKERGKNIKIKLKEKRERRRENEQRMLRNKAGIDNTRIKQNEKTEKYKPG